MPHKLREVKFPTYLLPDVIISIHSIYTLPTFQSKTFVVVIKSFIETRAKSDDINLT